MTAGPLTRSLCRTELTAVLADCLLDRVNNHRLDGVAAALRNLWNSHTVSDLMELEWPSRLGGDAANRPKVSFPDYMEKLILPELGRSVRIRAPEPGAVGTPDDGRGDLIESTRLYGLLCDGLRKFRGPNISRERREEMANEFFLRINGYRDQINAEFDQPEHPDIPRIVRDLMMVDILRMLIETLQADKLARDVGFLWRVFGRRALNRAGDTLAAFIAKPEMANRFEAMFVLTQVEDLLTLCDQVMAGDREAAEQEADNAFLRMMGAEAIQRFAGLAGDVAGLMLAENVTNDPDNLAQESNADRIERVGMLLRFATRIAGTSLDRLIAPRRMRQLGDSIAALLPDSQGQDRTKLEILVKWLGRGGPPPARAATS